MSAHTTDDIWAVSGPRIEHWDGTAWTEVASPGIGVLRGIVAVSATDAWAVGSDANDLLIEHWDGTAWSDVG